MEMINTVTNTVDLTREKWDIEVFKCRSYLSERCVWFVISHY